MTLTGTARNGVAPGVNAVDSKSRPTSYKFIDRRTGKRVSLASAGPLYLAMITLGGWKARDRKGKRPDVHELIPHIAIAIDDGR